MMNALRVHDYRFRNVLYIQFWPKIYSSAGLSSSAIDWARNCALLSHLIQSSLLWDR